MKLPDPKKDEAATEVKCFNSACPYSFQDSLEVTKGSKGNLLPILLH